MRCVFICPYFGKLPSDFQIWLNSCGYNKKFDFLLITDDKTTYDYPSNIRVIYWTFNDLKEKIQSKFDFEISLENPYKLCDFKPAYGYIFEDLLGNYEFWGHCDLDLILGDLENFLTHDIMIEYEKILFLGHMTLYRNTNEVNKRFMKNINSNINYKEIFTNPNNFAFDEVSNYSINSIYKFYSLPVYIDQIYADVSCMNFNFYLSCFSKYKNNFYTVKNRQIFACENGKVFGYTLHNNEITKKEYAYIHLQKRVMSAEIDLNAEKFLILPNKYVPYQQPSQRLIKDNSRPKIFYLPFFKNKYKALIFRMNKFLKNK